MLPGVVDDKVHFREPGLTHKEDIWHASHAYAKGGVTTFLEMPNTIPNAITQQRLEEKLAIASQVENLDGVPMRKFVMASRPKSLRNCRTPRWLLT